MERVRIARQGRDCAVRKPLHVDVSPSHVGHAIAGGRKPGIHERRRRGVRSAELFQRASLPIEDPVVAAGILPPHPLSVGEEQQQVAVGRPCVVVEIQRLARTRRHQLARGDVDTAGACGGLVAHDVGRIRDRRRFLHRGIGGPGFDPPRRSEALRREVRRSENAAHHVVDVLRHLRHHGWEHRCDQRQQTEHDSHASLLDLRIRRRMYGESRSLAPSALRMTRARSVLFGHKTGNVVSELA